jgi:hypothetical protein
MNPHALRICEALRRWRTLADILLSKNNTDSCPSGMPKEKDLSIKDLCALYILLDRRLQHRAPKMNRQDDKRLAAALEMYKCHFFSENFGDGGYLAHMKDYEDDRGESMADIIDTKYGTNLALAWTSADTKSANDLGTKIRGDYRDETEGGDEAKAVEDEAWHAFIAFEARHRIIAERSKLSGNLCGKGKSSGE